MKKINIFKNDILINTFKSVKQASEYLNVSSSYICDCLKNNRLCKKHRLEYA